MAANRSTARRSVDKSRITLRKTTPSFLWKAALIPYTGIFRPDSSWTVVVITRYVLYCPR